MIKLKKVFKDFRLQLGFMELEPLPKARAFFSSFFVKSANPDAFFSDEILYLNSKLDSRQPLNLPNLMTEPFNPERDPYLVAGLICTIRYCLEDSPVFKYDWQRNLFKEKPEPKSVADKDLRGALESLKTGLLQYATALELDIDNLFDPDCIPAPSSSAPVPRR